MRLLAFVAILTLLWVPPYGLIRSLVADRNTVSILATVLLFVEFFALLWFWARWVHQSPHPFRQYGLHLSRSNRLGFLKGLVVGFACLMAMFVIEGALGWVKWRLPSLQFSRIVAEGLLVAIGVGVGEELIFRGWLLDELERDYQPITSLWADSLIFATLHYLKPIREAIKFLLGASLSLQEVLRTLPQFPGLVLLGLLLVWARDAKGLGQPIGLHAGLVWGYYIVNVGDLAQYTDRVPQWVTGIDSNPLAGVMGMLCLGTIALWVRRSARLRA